MKKQAETPPAKSEEFVKGMVLVLSMLLRDSSTRSSITQSTAYKKLVMDKDITRYLQSAPPDSLPDETLLENVVSPEEVAELHRLLKEIRDSDNDSHLCEGLTADEWYKEVKRITCVLTTAQIVQLMCCK